MSGTGKAKAVGTKKGTTAEVTKSARAEMNSQNGVKKALETAKSAKKAQDTGGNAEAKAADSKSRHKKNKPPRPLATKEAVHAMYEAILFQKGYSKENKPRLGGEVHELCEDLVAYTLDRFYAFMLPPGAKTGRVNATSVSTFLHALLPVPSAATVSPDAYQRSLKNLATEGCHEFLEEARQVKAADAIAAEANGADESRKVSHLPESKRLGCSLSSARLYKALKKRFFKGITFSNDAILVFCAIAEDVLKATLLAADDERILSKRSTLNGDDFIQGIKNSEELSAAFGHVVFGAHSIIDSRSVSAATTSLGAAKQAIKRRKAERRQQAIAENNAEADDEQMMED